MGHIPKPIRFSRVHMFLPSTCCYPTVLSLSVVGFSISSSAKFYGSKLCFVIPFHSDEGTGSVLPFHWGLSHQHLREQQPRAEMAMRRGEASLQRKASVVFARAAPFCFLAIAFAASDGNKREQLHSSGTADTDHFSLAFQGNKMSTSPNEKLLL